MYSKEAHLVSANPEYQHLVRDSGSWEAHSKQVMPSTSSSVTVEDFPGGQGIVSGNTSRIGMSWGSLGFRGLKGLRVPFTGLGLGLTLKPWRNPEKGNLMNITSQILKTKSHGLQNEGLR